MTKAENIVALVAAEIPSVEPDGQPSRDSAAAAQFSSTPNGAAESVGDLEARAADDDPGGIRATLTELWQDLFGEFCQGGRSVVLGLDTDFFAAGGSSIIAVMMLSGVYEQFGVNVPLGVLMEKPTIRALSDHIISLALEGQDPADGSFEGM
jgi:acyl carrier protein